MLTMHALSGRTAILTGASGGIGSYIDQALSRQKMNLVLAGLAAPSLDELAENILKTTNAITVVMDVTKRDDLERLVTQTIEKYGGLDLLVNNVGIEMISRYHTLAPDDIERSINVNLTSAMVLTRLVLPEMLAVNEDTLLIYPLYRRKLVHLALNHTQPLRLRLLHSQSPSARNIKGPV